MYVVSIAGEHSTQRGDGGGGCAIIDLGDDGRRHRQRGWGGAHRDRRRGAGGMAWIAAVNRGDGVRGKVNQQVIDAEGGYSGGVEGSGAQPIGAIIEGDGAGGSGASGDGDSQGDGGAIYDGGRRAGRGDERRRRCRAGGDVYEARAGENAGWIGGTRAVSADRLVGSP